ncbi:homogentisate 1,2-dioxygenase [Sphingomonas echinoides]|uniref:homogentisate 1,2-dioxygenase n=1 Tax=Sphingomonas echinoides TaxID=59803 RepID=UPI003D68184B
MMLIPLLALAAAPQTMSAMDHPTVACPATVAPLPAGLEGWTRKQAVRAGATAKVATTLPLGVGVSATLLPTPKIAYPVRPQKPGGSVSSGGIFAFTVPVTGRYRVALGAGAWIDVLSGTTPATSVSHSHGSDCTGVRKMVDFDLKPGRYLLQVVGNPSATLSLMVARMP